jgi:hypothetical protein
MGLYDDWKAANASASDKQIANIEFAIKSIDIGISLLTFSSPLSRSGNTISLAAASAGTNGYMSSTDKSRLDAAYQAGTSLSLSGQILTLNKANNGTASTVTLPLDSLTQNYNNLVTNANYTLPALSNIGDVRIHNGVISSTSGSVYVYPPNSNYDINCSVQVANRGTGTPSRIMSLGYKYGESFSQIFTCNANETAYFMVVYTRRA